LLRGRGEHLGEPAPGVTLGLAEAKKSLLAEERLEGGPDCAAHRHAG
jgi:hypothetical protein